VAVLYQYSIHYLDRENVKYLSRRRREKEESGICVYILFQYEEERRRSCLEEKLSEASAIFYRSI